MEAVEVAASSRRVRPPLTTILRSFFAGLLKCNFLAHLEPDNAATELTNFRSGLLISAPWLEVDFSVRGKCSSVSMFSSSYLRLESKMSARLPLDRG